MRRTTLLLLLLLLPAAAGRAQETAPRLRWDHEGFARLSTAAAQAKKGGKRLLVGLSGGMT